MRIEVNFNHPITKLALAILDVIDRPIEIQFFNSGSFILKHGDTTLTDPYKLWEFLRHVFKLRSGNPALLEEAILRELLPSVAHMDFTKHITSLNSLYSENVLSILLSEARMLSMHIDYMIPSLVHNTQFIEESKVKFAVCNVPKWYVDELYRHIRKQENDRILLTYVDISDKRYWSIRCPTLYYEFANRYVSNDFKYAGGGHNGRYGFVDTRFLKPSDVIHHLITEFTK